MSCLSRSDMRSDMLIQGPDWEGLNPETEIAASGLEKLKFEFQDI